jgi:cystathionine gamma-synthase
VKSVPAGQQSFGDNARVSRPRPTGTDAVHAGTPDRRPAHTLAPSIAQTATFTFADTADLERYFSGADPDRDREEYGRYGNPTVREMERRVAALDGAEDALLFASGMAAITAALLALVKAGDHVLLFRDGYRRTRQLVASTLGRMGVTHTLVEPASIEGLRGAIGPKTRVALTEFPTNPYLRCLDLRAMAGICRAARVKTIVDATFSTPFGCRPLDYGVDLVIQSATKYLAGHNDVLGGTASGSASLVSLVRDVRDVTGGICDPHAAALIGRGMKTLAVRFDRQSATALAVAQALERQPSVERVYYPLLSSHPDHVLARQLLRAGGGVVSFVVSGGRTAASRVVDGFRLATIAPSLGGVETLVEQPAIMSFHELSDDELVGIGIAPGLVRLAVGIEDPEDIVADAVRAVGGATTGVGA